MKNTKPKDLLELKQEVFEKYPKSAQKVKEYFIRKVTETVTSANYPEEVVNDALAAIDDTFVALVITYSSDRVLEVLDDMKIYISVFYDESSEGSFTYTNSHSGYSNTKPTRPEATAAAIEEVFQLIEEGKLG